MTIIIDNGHGRDTAGKRSPDGRLMEWAWTREVARQVQERLQERGYDARLLVEEDDDVPLRERVRRANAMSAEAGKGGAVLVSLHVNAAGADGKWHEARGFSAYVSGNASERSKRLAKALYERAVAMGLKGNRWEPEEGYIVQSLAITRDTDCPAVLTENLFQDNREDVEYLLSDEGRRAIAELHAEAIEEYANSVK